MDTARRHNGDATESFRVRHRNSERSTAFEATTRASHSVVDAIGEKIDHTRFVHDKIFVKLPRMKIIDDDEGDEVLDRSFHAVTLWMAMLIHSCHSNSKHQRAICTSRRFMTVATAKKLLRNSIVMGVYMWNVVCMRLYCRKSRSDVCRSIANAPEGDDGVSKMLHELPGTLARQRDYMVSCEYAQRAPEVNIVNIVREFCMQSVVRAQHVMPTVTDDMRADIHKRHALVNVLDPDCNPQATKANYNIDTMVNTGDLDRFYDEIDRQRYIKKFTWFMYRVLPLDFALRLLDWYNNISGSNPHRDLVDARALFLYMYTCISGRGFEPDKGATATSLSERAKSLGSRQSKAEIDDQPRDHGQGELINFLDVMLNAVECTASARSCRPCQYTLIEVLKCSGSKSESERKELHKCPVAMCAVSIKCRVSNMTKRIQKRTGEHQLPIAMSPVLKQMLSLIVFKNKMTVVGRTQRCRDAERTHAPVYRWSAATPRGGGRDTQDVSVADMKQYTMYPFTIEELFRLRDLNTFLISVAKKSGALAHLSVHVVDLFKSRDECRFLVYAPFASPAKDEEHRKYVSAYIVRGVRNMAAFWRHSPFADSSRVLRIKSFRLSTGGTLDFKRTFLNNVERFVNSCS